MYRLLFSVCSATMPLAMTNYQLKPPSTLSSLAVMEKKEARKKLLEEIRKRRLQNSQNRLKHQRQAYQDNDEYREYQDMLKA
jgi:hypothetical protein